VLTERFRVAMADVDAAGIIYYATPLRWAERITSAWLADIGLPIRRILADGLGAPAVRTEVLYHEPLAVDDEVEASLSLERAGSTSFTSRVDFRRAGRPEIAVEVRTVQVWVRLGHDEARTLAATPLPAAITRAAAR
jgi:YbgC/YbaW family acyl-CoA thioester hydrolase